MIWSVLSTPSIFSRGRGLVIASISSSVKTFLACEFFCALESRTAAATGLSELDVCGGAARDDGGVLCPAAAEATASASPSKVHFRSRRNGRNPCIAIHRSGRPTGEKGHQSAKLWFPTRLPAAPFPQRRDVPHMVRPVPGVQREILFQGNRSQLGMAKGTHPVTRIERTQQTNPAVVQGIQHGQRYFDGSLFRIRQFGPELLLIPFNGRFVLGKRQFESQVRIHVAVRQVV